MIRTITLSVALVLMAGLQNLKAQSTFSLNMMESYVNAYTEPFAKAFPIGLGGGWTHTANVHSFLGFDVTMSASLVMIPSSAGTVKTTDINLPDGFSFADASANVPTIRAKSDVAAPDINILLSAGGYEVFLPLKELDCLWPLRLHYRLALACQKVPKLWHALFPI